jgi:hypothetical protein
VGGKTMGGKQRRWLRLGCRQRGLGADVRTVRLTSGPHAVLIFFQFIKNWLNFKKSKWVPYLASKILNFCMPLALDIMNNFFNYADI